MSLFLLHALSAGASAMAICLERLHPSRHLTPRPGHRNHMHSYSQDVHGAGHSPFSQAAAAAGSASTSLPACGLVLPCVLPGLVAIGCSPTDAERVHEAAVMQAGSAAAVDASLFGGRPIGIALPVGATVEGSRSMGSAVWGGGGGGGVAAANTCPYPLPSPAARECTPLLTEGWEGVGALAGDVSLCPIPLADLELLRDVFAEGEEGGEVDVRVEA